MQELHMKPRLYISSICPEAPSVCFCTKFGIEGPFEDVINCTEFFINRFRGIDFVGGVKFAYLHGN